MNTFRRIATGALAAAAIAIPARHAWAQG